jgi:ribonuclease HII
MGYAVPEHLAALKRLGPTPHHRSFFAPVVAARQRQLGLSDDSLLLTETTIAIEATV